MILLDIVNESERPASPSKRDLAVLAERVCEGEGLEGDIELSMLLCDDQRIRELNRDYRKRDEPTDVLSFSQRDGDRAPLPHDAPLCLGDIVISLETANREFGPAPAAVKRGVRLLFCHGLLHLIGYDHNTAADTKRMAAKQAAYLDIPLDEAWPGAHSGGAEGT